MRWIATCAAVALWLGAAAGCAPSPWKEYKSPRGRFSVVLPGTPKEDRQIVQSPMGDTLLTTCKLATPACVFTVTRTDFPVRDFKAEQAVDLAGAMMKQILSQHKGVAPRDLKVEGAPAKEFTVTVPPSKELPGGGTLKERVLMDGDRLFQVSVLIYPHKGTMQDADRFLNSFRILPRT